MAMTHLHSPIKCYFSKGSYQVVRILIDYTALKSAQPPAQNAQMGRQHTSTTAIAVVSLIWLPAMWHLTCELRFYAYASLPTHGSQLGPASWW